MARKARYTDAETLKRLIRVARGEIPAEVVLRGATWLDVYAGAFREGDLAFAGGVIVGVGEHYEGTVVVDAKGLIATPGFIDAHVHVESSLMVPARFQEAVLPRGTTTAIWDPHEITNVKGLAGLEWALGAADGLDLDLFVMVPSCVPSTSPAAGLETSGATLLAQDIKPWKDHPGVLGLAEMMNFPGLLGGDPDVMDKLMDYGGLKRDGHCPGLSGKDLNAYGVAGIHSCHESTTLAEAREKLTKGIHVLIREGSCARNASTLLPILDAYTSAVVSFCSDDRNPADIAEAGHIDCIINQALAAGGRPEDAFRAASYAPSMVYGLDDRGALAPGYLADVVLLAPRSRTGSGVIDWRAGVDVRSVFKQGKLVDAAALGRAAAKSVRAFPGKNLHLGEAKPETFRVAAPAGSSASREARVIGVIPGQIVTEPLVRRLSVEGGAFLADHAGDVLKIAVLERHQGSGGKAAAFVHGFGLRKGAIATSINHDSHNVIVVGDGDALMAKAVNRLRAIDGGIVVIGEDGTEESLALPVGGLMTDASPAVVAATLHKLKHLARRLGCKLEEPFLTLSFLALPVIPTLKITDRGLVDVGQFKLVPVGI